MVPGGLRRGESLVGPPACRASGRGPRSAMRAAAVRAPPLGPSRSSSQNCHEVTIGGSAARPQGAFSRLPAQDSHDEQRTASRGRARSRWRWVASATGVSAQPPRTNPRGAESDRAQIPRESRTNPACAGSKRTQARWHPRPGRSRACPLRGADPNEPEPAREATADAAGARNCRTNPRPAGLRAFSGSRWRKRVRAPVLRARQSGAPMLPSVAPRLPRGRRTGPGQHLGRGLEVAGPGGRGSELAGVCCGSGADEPS
jgi:hypothetical protein